MARKSKGRGTAAAFGLLLLFGGLVGGGVLFASSLNGSTATWLPVPRISTQAVEGFARAPVGCTTTLDFTETGVFFVFEDVGPAVEIPDGGCEPTADPTRSFAFEMSGPDGPVVPRADESLSYDAGDYVGASVARVEVEVPGEYELVVVGDDPSAVAAIGRDPDDGVDGRRQSAIIVAAIGIVLGLLLLILAGRRSNKAGAFLTPDGPGWDLRVVDKDTIPTPDITHLAQRPVNPHAPAERVAIAPDLDEVDAMLAQAAKPEPTSPWAPPTVGDVAPTPVAAPAGVAPDPVGVETPAVDEVAPDPVGVETPAVDEVAPDPVGVETPAVDEVAPDPVGVETPAVDEVAPDPVGVETPAVDEVAPDSASDAAKVGDQPETSAQSDTEQVSPAPDEAATGTAAGPPPDEV